MGRNCSKLKKIGIMCILRQKNHIKFIKLRVTLNKIHLLSYYQLNRIGKKHRDTPKLGQNWSKLAKIGKNWYYVHFDTQKKNIYITNYEMKFIYFLLS